MECHHVGGQDSNMLSNEQKRFVLFWWFSTNIYLTCGKNNRIELPNCIISAFCSEYKNPPGVSYVGHKRKS